MDPVFSILLRLRLASVIKLEYSFFRANNLLNRITCILVHNVMKLLSVPGQQRPNLFQPIFIISRVNDLFLGSIKGNAILTLLSFFEVGCLFTNRFVEIAFFFVMENISKFIGKFEFFSELLLIFKKGYKLKDRRLRCCILNRFSFTLTLCLQPSKNSVGNI